MVPLGKSFKLGVIMSRTAPDQAQSHEYKPLAWPLEREPLLSNDVLELVRHLALRQMTREGQVLAAVLPKALRSTSITFAWVSDAGVRQTLSLKQILQAGPSELLEFGQAWQNGTLAPLVRENGVDVSTEYELLQDPPWQLRPGAKRQLAVLEYLFTHGRASRRGVQSAVSGDAARILNDLTRRGMVRAVLAGEETDKPSSWPCKDHVLCPEKGCTAGSILTEEQDVALKTMKADLAQGFEQNRGLVRLVHGVTGSGKTLLYLRLAEKCLAMGRSVLLLAPEVALSAQLWEQVCREFPEGVRHWHHGYLSPAAKLRVFRSLLHGGPKIVVGTRSALFLPFDRLGLVVVDEEHDGSYKQDEGFSYQAKEVAYFRVREGGLLILGSATPDIKTHQAAEQGEIAIVSLAQRISRSPTPEICLVDMRKESKSTPLSQSCQAELQQVLQRGEQAMFLLNRRGFAPLMSCLDCGQAPACPQCEVGLTYHKGWERLLCHYCGHTMRFPCVCGQCGGSRFLPMGQGTESLEEYLAGVLPPDQGIVRLDTDNTRRKGRLEDILGSFGQGRAQVMVGTQMLSKGHHFPNVTLVVAVDGDIGLNLPDYRAAEKTFQLLVQLAGRAGRGERPGRVLIQTRNPDHTCWGHILRGDYHGFFRQELERRRKFAYPPFVKLGMIRFSFPQGWGKGEELLSQATGHLQREGARMGLRVLGPAPAPLAQIKGRRRYHCLLKALQWQGIRDVYGSLLRVMPRTSPLRVGLDLDPVNML